MRRAFPEREGLNDSFNKNSIAYQKRDNKFLAGVWVCVRFLHGVPVGARFIAPTGWGRLMRTCAPLHPVGAINLAPTGWPSLRSAACLCKNHAHIHTAKLA